METSHSYRQHLSAGVVGQPRACLFLPLSLFSMCVCVCVCTIHVPPLHLLFLPLPKFHLSAYLPPNPPSSHHPLDLFLSFFFSAPVSEKQTPSVFLCLPAHYSPEAATPSLGKGQDKQQDYTCAQYECQIQNQ